MRGVDLPKSVWGGRRPGEYTTRQLNYELRVARVRRWAIRGLLIGGAVILFLLAAHAINTAMPGPW